MNRSETLLDIDMKLGHIRRNLKIRFENKNRLELVVLVTPSVTVVEDPTVGNSLGGISVVIEFGGNVVDVVGGVVDSVVVDTIVEFVVVVVVVVGVVVDVDVVVVEVVLVVVVLGVDVVVVLVDVDDSKTVESTTVG